MVGKKGEIFDLVDDEYFHIFDMFRYARCGMINLDIEKDPAILCNGVRALMELHNNG